MNYIVSSNFILFFYPKIKGPGNKSKSRDNLNMAPIVKRNQKALNILHRMNGFLLIFFLSFVSPI